jgi:acyl dehydratase
VERGAILPDPARVVRFLRVTGGAGIGAFRGDDAPLPPTYPCLWETALALELFGQSDLPFPSRGLIHLESEMVAVRPLRAREPVRCRVELERADPHRRGLRLLFRSRCWNAAGQLCQEDRLALLAPGEGGGRARGATPREAAASEPEPAAWTTVEEWALGPGAGRRYARASGDYNPVHLWGWSARLLGYRRPILHGFCLEAMAAHALIRHRLGGDPTALRRLLLRFRSPLLLPARVSLQVAGMRLRVVDVGDARRKPYAVGEFVG